MTVLFVASYHRAEALSHGPVPVVIVGQAAWRCRCHHLRTSHVRCPFCQSDNDRVIDSRSCENGFAIRRRRECFNCKRRYTTFERLEEMDIKVVKKDGMRDAFDPAKIRDGISKACWKRPVSAEQIDGIVAEIQNRLYTDFEKEVDSSQLGEIIMEHLRHLDQVAYVRFASVYREFKDAHDFVEEVQPMLDDAKRATR